MSGNGIDWRKYHADERKHRKAYKAEREKRKAMLREATADEHRKKKPKRLPRSKYAEYLKSEEWKKKRRGRLVIAGFQCERCRARGRLQVHHKTYDHLGFERMTDLEVLCDSCHADGHLAEVLGVTPEALDEFAARHFVDDGTAPF